jgi:hypothetical protein
MTFRNPWIDPRVQEVRPIQLLAYLHANKWIEGNARISTMRAFRDDHGHGYVLVPSAIDYDRYVQDIIDAVTMLAKAEDRYAGDVLTDLLAQPADNTEATPTIPAIPEKGDPLPQPVNR